MNKSLARAGEKIEQSCLFPGAELRYGREGFCPIWMLGRKHVRISELGKDPDLLGVDFFGNRIAVFSFPQDSLFGKTAWGYFYPTRKLHLLFPFDYLPASQYPFDHPYQPVQEIERKERLQKNNIPGKDCVTFATIPIRRRVMGEIFSAVEVLME